MSAEQTVPTLDPQHALRPSLLAQGSQRQPIFWMALIGAAVVHAVLVVGISRSQPRYLGDPNGNAESIDVELVDEGELRAMSSPPTSAAAPSTPPSPAAQATPAAEPPPAQAEPKPETEPAPQPQKSAALPTIDAPEPQAPQPAPDAVSKPSPPKESTKSDSAPKKQSETKPAPKAAPKLPSQLDLSVPFDMTMQGTTGGGGASSATRPQGITRTGENDRFGRDVIRALKKTMPPLDSVTGKVTVRILLDERGNIAKVKLMQGSGDHGLDDSVVFSVYQSSFPFPPKGATLADRTFLVTYNYHR